MADFVRPSPSLRAVADRLARARTAVGLAAFTAVFALLIFIVETLSLLGVPETILVWMLAIFALVVPPLAAISARTVSLTEFEVAGRRIGVAEQAAATSAGAFGAVFAIGLTAAFFRSEAEMSALALGLGGGLLLGGVLFAPYLRRGAARSPADFLAARFGSRSVSALAGLIIVAALLPMLVAELSLAATIGGWTLGMDRRPVVVMAALLMLVPPLAGGMRAVTVAGVMQFLLLIAALAFASLWLSKSATGYTLPLGGYLAAAQNLQAGGKLNDIAAPWRLAGIGLCMTLGIAVFPSLLMRATAARSTRSARSAIARTLLVAALFSLACASLAAVAKWSVQDSPLRARSIAELVAQPWIVNWVARGGELVKLCGEPASEAGASCPAGPLQSGALAIDPNIALLAAPGIAGAPPLIGLLLAMGCLVAALAAGSLGLLGIGQALGGDALARGSLPHLPVSLQLLARRFALVAAAVFAAIAALAPPADFLRLALASISLAASGLFPVLLIGIWWPRANWIGALSGMALGFAIALYLACATIYDARLLAWLEPTGLADLARHLGTEMAALVAVPAGLTVAVITSLATRPPDVDQHAFAAALLAPRDLPADDQAE